MPIFFFLVVKRNVLQQKELYKIWEFHGGDYEECNPLGSYAVWLL
jgi:hypothetical protein